MMQQRVCGFPNDEAMSQVGGDTMISWNFAVCTMRFYGKGSLITFEFLSPSAFNDLSLSQALSSRWSLIEDSNRWKHCWRSRRQSFISRPLHSVLLPLGHNLRLLNLQHTTLYSADFTSPSALLASFASRPSASFRLSACSNFLSEATAGCFIARAPSPSLGSRSGLLCSVCMNKRDCW